MIGSKQQKCNVMDMSKFTSAKREKRGNNFERMRGKIIISKSAIELNKRFRYIISTI